MESLAPDQKSMGRRMKKEAYWPPPFPPGVRFIPTDEELIKYFLTCKVHRLELSSNFFIEDDLYQYHPQELAEKYMESIMEGHWYVFTRRIRKYANGGRPNRSAGMGYWKATGSDQKILNSEGNKIGYKKSLAYYEGKQPQGEKTGWVMQEYRIDEFQRPLKDKTMVLDDHVLCKIYYKDQRNPKMTQDIPMEQSYQPNFEAPQDPSDAPSGLETCVVLPGYEYPTMLDDEGLLCSAWTG